MGTGKVIAIVATSRRPPPKSSAAEIRVTCSIRIFSQRRNPSCEGDFRSAIAATVTHKALMILEGLMGHLHEEVIGRMRGNMKNPEPRADNAEILDFQFNPFPGADVISTASRGR